MVEKFIAACSRQLGCKQTTEPDDVRPIISSSFNSRGQVDLINMIATPDPPYNWILHYQDHHEKMSYLCAIENKQASTVLFKDEDGYKEGDVLCPSCDSRADPALLCLPVTQYDEDNSEEGGSDADSYVSDDNQCCCGCGQDAPGSHHYCLYRMKCVLQSCYHPDQEVGEEDGNISYCLQCYGKVACGGARSNNEDEVEEPLSTTIANGQCCCGCGMDAALSNQYCIHSGKWVMAWCFHESQEVEEGYGSKALCKKSYYSIVPSDGTPNRKAMRDHAKESLIQQGDRMRSFAQERAQGAMQTPIEVGTVV